MSKKGCKQELHLVNNLGQLEYFFKKFTFATGNYSSILNLKDCKCICPYLCFAYLYFHLQDVTRPPVDCHSHLYEDVRDGGLYQDILFSSLPSPPPLFDHRFLPQRNEWRSSTYPQVCKQNPNLSDHLFDT